MAPPPRNPWDYVSDPENWAILSGQVPPKNFVGFHRKADRFDVGAFDQVVAYRFGFDRWAARFAGLDQAVGCNNDRAIAKDGTLCPSIVLPGKDVGVWLGQELERRFNAPRLPDDLEPMCQAEYHHGFVFYREGVPVGELLVSFDCPRWQASPGFEEHYPLGPSQHRTWMRAQCRKLDLGFCDPASEEELREGQAWWKQHAEEFTGRFQPRPLPVDGSKRLADLTERDKLELCVWHTQHLGFSPPEIDRYELGEQWAEALNWKRCVETFPKCADTLDELGDCVEAAQTGDPLFQHPPHKHCRERSQCIWGWSMSP